MPTKTWGRDVLTTRHPWIHFFFRNSHPHLLVASCVLPTPRIVLNVPKIYLYGPARSQANLHNNGINYNSTILHLSFTISSTAYLVSYLPASAALPCPCKPRSSCSTLSAPWTLAVVVCHSFHERTFQE